MVLLLIAMPKYDIHVSDTYTCLFRKAGSICKIQVLGWIQTACV